MYHPWLTEPFLECFWVFVVGKVYRLSVFAGNDELHNHIYRWYIVFTWSSFACTLQLMHHAQWRMGYFLWACARQSATPMLMHAKLRGRVEVYETRLSVACMQTHGKSLHMEYRWRKWFMCHTLFKCTLLYFRTNSHCIIIISTLKYIIFHKNGSFTIIHD